MHIKQKNNARKINLFVIGFIVLLIGGIIGIFVRHRLILKKNDPPPPPESTEANLTIKNFHHVASEDGKKKWTLDAASASLYSQKNTVELNDIFVTFYIDDRQSVTLNADSGKLNSKTNDMTLQGKIVASMAPYMIKTETLNYEHQLRILHSDTPVDITGESMSLKADTMTYRMNSSVIECDGNVKGSFIENIEQ